jgi:hypothetical protein
MTQLVQKAKVRTVYTDTYRQKAFLCLTSRRAAYRLVVLALVLVICMADIWITSFDSMVTQGFHAN